MFCGQCGKPNHDTTAKFCRECGASLSDGVASPTGVKPLEKPFNSQGNRPKSEQSPNLQQKNSDNPVLGLFSLGFVILYVVGIILERHKEATLSVWLLGISSVGMSVFSGIVSKSFQQVWRSLLGIIVLTFILLMGLDLLFPATKGNTAVTGKSEATKSTSALPSLNSYNSASNSANAMLFPVEVNDKWGYINRSGKLIILPQYEYAGYFHEGLAPVVEVNYKSGYINTSGKWVWKPTK